ncbi:hypothetical protein CK203_065252 [Vitis vinifera]|uniref:Reverse transcriptase/retrotransposon-derived protein RNase H-like domain-containing protein n=1 Tax=Vitis vinifera TaxID=29760 RepID=A0A438G6S2_VITVI|nr:hypothetical protein CK203_065252 [Vitis vinifera]
MKRNRSNRAHGNQAQKRFSSVKNQNKRKTTQNSKGHMIQDCPENKKFIIGKPKNENKEDKQKPKAQGWVFAMTHRDAQATSNMVIVYFVGFLGKLVASMDFDLIVATPMRDSVVMHEKDLVLNWEKCHFMVRQGIVLGHIISEKGIEVDKAKVELIVKLPSPTIVKGLLAKDAKFIWDERCQNSFDQLKKFLTTPIVRAPNWQLPFELMCDASDFAIGAVLGQREDGKPYVIYYARQNTE